MEKSQSQLSGFIGKAQLALAYAPEISVKGALKRFHEWLHSSSTLLAELVANGYRDRQKYFTPLQVQIIYRHLGEP